MGGEWETATWGNIASLEYGKSLRSYSDKPDVAEVYGTNGKIGWHDEGLWKGPGVIVGRKGAYRGVHYTENSFWVIDTAYSLVPRRKLNLRWAYYALKHLDPNTIDDGSPIPSTTRAALYAQRVLVPPLAEQESIASILGALDDKIELNRRLAGTLEAIARALFRSWFIDFDPVRAKAEGHPTGLPDDLAALFPQSLDDDKPDGWVQRSLTSVATFLNGLALQKYPAADGQASVPVIKIADMRTGPTQRSSRANLDIPSDYFVNDGDHLFSWSGSLIHSRWVHGRAALNQHLFKVTPINGLPSWLSYFAVDYHLPGFQAIASSKAVTMGHIQRHHLDEASIPLPPSDLLDHMDKIMAPLHARALAAQLESRTLVAFRDTLLPKLITGELRIADAAAEVSAA